MVASGYRLVLLPLRSLSVEPALTALAHLEDAGAVEIVHAARLERGRNGRAPQFVDVSPQSTLRLEPAAWARLLDGTIANSDVAVSPADRSECGLSESFVAELRELLPTASEWLVLVVRRLEPGAVVAELAPFPETRLVYGALPEPVLESLRGAAPSSDERDDGHLTLTG